MRRRWAPRGGWSVPRPDPVQAITWILALMWAAPLIYAGWAAFHLESAATHLDLRAGLTLRTITDVWQAAPFGRYYVTTVLLVTGTLAVQFVVATLAAFAVVRIRFPLREVVFTVLLVQIMVVPEVLILTNYRSIAALGQIDTITGIALPSLASGLAVLLLRQTFRSVPIELDEAAVLEGAGRLRLLWSVYVPLARPTYLAFGLVSVSYHWNAFLWPVVVSQTTRSRPLSVGLQLFSASETGVQWSSLSAAALLVVAPLLIAFLLFQRQFLRSFARAGIR